MSGVYLPHAVQAARGLATSPTSRTAQLPNVTASIQYTRGLAILPPLCKELNFQRLRPHNEGPAAVGVPAEHVIGEGEHHDAIIFDRNKLHEGLVVVGPAIVSEMDSTTVVLPGYEAKVDAVGNLLINPGAKEA